MLSSRSLADEKRVARIPGAVSHVALLLANTSRHSSRSDQALRQAEDHGTPEDEHSEDDGNLRVVITVIVLVLRHPDVIVVLLTHRGGLNRLGLGRL